MTCCQTFSLINIKLYIIYFQSNDRHSSKLYYVQNLHDISQAIKLHAVWRLKKAIWSVKMSTHFLKADCDAFAFTAYKWAPVF